MSSIISGIAPCSLFIYRCLRFANVICYYHPIFLIFRFHVSCCVQEYSGCRVVKHNFRYRVSIRSCFLSVIYAPSCNRCFLITPVPGAWAPCTSPSPFPSSIEPRGMHQRGALLRFLLPPETTTSRVISLSRPPARSLPRRGRARGACPQVRPPARIPAHAFALPPHLSL